MPFMYLHLTVDQSTGGVDAEIRNEGQINSLGGPHSRSMAIPFAVFQVQNFTGIDCISDSEIMAEIMRRFTTRELFQKLRLKFTNGELLEMMAGRLRPESG